MQTQKTEPWTMRSFATAVAASVVLSFFLSACDPNEQDRVLRYEKGTYLGEPDTPLSADARNELRARARLQAQ